MRSAVCRTAIATGSCARPTMSSICRCVSSPAATLTEADRRRTTTRLAGALRERVAGRSASTAADGQTVGIRVQLPDGVLDVEAPRKRLYTGTIYHVRGLGGRHRAAAVRHRGVVHAQPGARHPPPRRRRRGVRHGPRPRPDQARGRDRGAAGRHRLQPHAGAHPPLPAAAHRDAGRRLARPAHAADPAAPRAGHAAGQRGARGRTWRR